MGLMRFVVSPRGRITGDLVEQAYLTGIDLSTWKVRAALENGQLILQREASDSANLHLPWPIEGRGWLGLTTGCLIERAQPYHIPLELARGAVGQLRNQLAEWQMIGLKMPGTITTQVDEAVNILGQAAVSQEDLPKSAALAEKVLRIALSAGDMLTDAYVNWSMAQRTSRPVDKKIHVGGDLGDALLDDTAVQPFLLAFDTARLPFCWRDIESSAGHFDWNLCDRQVQWCEKYDLRILAGPLLRLDPLGLPEWLCSRGGDFDDIAGHASEFIRTVVTRYRGKIDAWQCTGGINTADVFDLSEEEKLRMTVSLSEQVHWLDPRTPTFVSFDQPWGEYMSRQDFELPPLHIAATLLRAGLNLQGAMLEINVGYHPGGTLPRSLLQFSRQLDFWGLLGLPIWVALSVPSDVKIDPLASPRVNIHSGYWTPEAQRHWVANYLPLILAKPFVQGVIWSQLRDSRPHAFPHGGLFDQIDQPKPSLGQLASIRQTYLGE
jgi:hypothetical protein